MDSTQSALGIASTGQVLSGREFFGTFLSLNASGAKSCL